MIKGIGTDIIEVDRIRKAIERHKQAFLRRVFTEKELAYCLQYQNPYPHLAARFAAKEAAVKALGSGFCEGMTWISLEISRDARGKPYLSFVQCPPPEGNWFVTISHCRRYATATVLWTSD